MDCDAGMQTGAAALQLVSGPVGKCQVEGSADNELAHDCQCKEGKHGAHHIGLFADVIRANSDITPIITDDPMIPEGNL